VTVLQRADDHVQNLTIVRCDVRQLAGQARLKADTVVMNPPFGTRRKGACAVVSCAQLNIGGACPLARGGKVASGVTDAAPACHGVQVNYQLPLPAAAAGSAAAAQAPLARLAAVLAVSFLSNA